jgi:hypothetical protein
MTIELSANARGAQVCPPVEPASLVDDVYGEQCALSLGFSDRSERSSQRKQDSNLDPVDFGRHGCAERAETEN